MKHGNASGGKPGCLARLRHPNIVQVYDLLVVDRELWIVMESFRE